MIPSEGSVNPTRWLVLFHQIPPKPDYLRVKVRRRLSRAGAIPLKNSVYALPHTEETLEDFQWVRRLVVDEGGDATLMTAGFLEGITDQELEDMFRVRSDAEYEEIIETARTAPTSANEADTRRFRRQLQDVAARDFFGSDRADAALDAVRDLERHVAGPTASSGEPGDVPTGATWVTRTGVFVDRIASAWLIRRFIDPGARFAFVPSQGYVPRPGELRFDMFEGEYTHEGDDCTFEVLVRRFQLTDPALRDIAEVVHDIDCKDDKFGRDEAAGVASVLRGIVLAHDDDAARLRAGAELFDGLYTAMRGTPE